LRYDEGGQFIQLDDTLQAERDIMRGDGLPESNCTPRFSLNVKVNPSALTA
jgi:hypothetical protein